MAKKLWALSLYAERSTTEYSGRNVKIHRNFRYLAGSLLAETADEAQAEGMAWLQNNFKASDGWSDHGVAVSEVPALSIIGAVEWAAGEVAHANQTGK